MRNIIRHFFTLLFIALIFAGCSKSNEYYSFSFKSPDTTYVLGESVVRKVPSNDAYTIPLCQLKKSEILRLQQDGMTKAIVNVDSYCKSIDLSEVNVFTGPKCNNGIVSYQKGWFKVEVPYDSVIKRDSDVCLRGWGGPETKIRGNVVPGAFLCDYDKVFFSSYISVAERKKQTNDFATCSLRKNTPITITFNAPSTVPGRKFPMWHFDETNCRWTIDAYAYSDGHKCICTVNELGWWTCSKPTEAYRQVTLFVVDKNENPIHNACIKVSNGSRFEEYLTAADGTCVFYVPIKDFFYVYYKGLDLPKLQTEYPFEVEYVNLPSDSLLFSISPLPENIGRQTVIDVSLPDLYREYNAIPGLGVEDVIPSSYDDLCIRKLALNGTTGLKGKNYRSDPNVYLYYHTKDGKEERAYLEFKLPGKERINLDYPVKIEAAFPYQTSNILNIKKVRDEYSRNAMLDITNDYINPAMLDGGSLSLEFAGLDSVYNTTITIPSLKENFVRQKSFPIWPVVILVLVLTSGIVYLIVSHNEKKEMDLCKLVAAVLKHGPIFNSDDERRIYNNHLELLMKEFSSLLLFHGFKMEKIKELMEKDTAELLDCMPNVARNTDLEMRCRLVHFLFKIAAKNDGIKDDEWILLNRIMYGLKLNQTNISYFQRVYEGLRTYWDSSSSNNTNTGNGKEQPANNAKTNGYDGDYALLCVPKGASLEQIKEAYHKLAKEYHPDLPKNAKRHAECVEKMAAINLAYDRLMKQPS